MAVPRRPMRGAKRDVHTPCGEHGDGHRVRAVHGLVQLMEDRTCVSSTDHSRSMKRSARDSTARRRDHCRLHYPPRLRRRRHGNRRARGRGRLPAGHVRLRGGTQQPRHPAGRSPGQEVPRARRSKSARPRPGSPTASRPAKFFGSLLGVEVESFDGEFDPENQLQALQTIAGGDWDFVAVHPAASDALSRRRRCGHRQGHAADRHGHPPDPGSGSSSPTYGHLTFLEPDNIYMGFDRRHTSCSRRSAAKAR